MPKDDSSEFILENVRQPSRPERIEQAVNLWLAEGVLAPEEARRRSAELLMVAVKREDGSVMGVCTTYLDTPVALRMPMWCFRTFVAKSCRQQNVALRLLLAARDFHEQQFVSGADTSGRGLYMEIENLIIQKHRNEAVWLRSKMVFIGFNARGDHCRAYYFPGARVS